MTFRSQISRIIHFYKATAPKLIHMTGTTRVCQILNLTTRMRKTSYLRKSTTAINLICNTTTLFLNIIRPITNKVLMKIKIQTRDWTQQGTFQTHLSTTTWTKISPTVNCNQLSSQTNQMKTIKMSQSRTHLSTYWTQKMTVWYPATERTPVQPLKITLPTIMQSSTIRVSLLIRVARRVKTKFLAKLEIKIMSFWQLVPWMVG